MRDILGEHACQLKNIAFCGAVVGAAAGTVLYIVNPTLLCLPLLKCITASQNMTLAYNVTTGVVTGAITFPLAFNTYSLWSQSRNQAPVQVQAQAQAAEFQL